MGTLHGARICEAEGIPLSELIPSMPEGGCARSLLTTIESGDFTAGSATPDSTETPVKSVASRAAPLFSLTLTTRRQGGP